MSFNRVSGSTVVKQPLTEDGLTLCWNGEAWSISGNLTIGNDTHAIFKLLTAHDELNTCTLNSRTEILDHKARLLTERLSQVAGPYAFVFHDGRNQALYFGRDFLGRRSLLTRCTAEGDLLISSVSDAEQDVEWTEVEADGLYYIDLASYNPALSSQSGPVRQKMPYVYSHTQDPPLIRNSLDLNQEISASPSTLCESSPSVARLHDLLLEALSLRTLNVPLPPSGEPQRDDSIARIAILFSGGIDCTVLARLSHDVLPPTYSIDLLNVAFQNPRIHKSVQPDGRVSDEIYETCPDRITGRASFEELKQVCSHRHWRFIAINVPFEDTQAHRQKVISLMHPHNTEMDLSICFALYFASRGIGAMCDSTGLHSSHQYRSTARVLLSGLGADELFGGYTRHATAYRRNGYKGLIEELALDVRRLGKRNLGRDDRVLSNWGREVRFPFLDEELIRAALAMPIQEKCGFGESVPITPDLQTDACKQLEPGKKILRCLAVKLGMHRVAMEKKRAIQFGARTAKMETGKIKGTQQLRS